VRLCATINAEPSSPVYGEVPGPRVRAKAGPRINSAGDGGCSAAKQRTPSVAFSDTSSISMGE